MICVQTEKMNILKSVQYTDIWFAPLQRNTFKVSSWLLLTLIHFNVCTLGGTTNTQVIFDLCPCFWSMLHVTIATASLVQTLNCWICRFWPGTWGFSHHPIGKKFSGVKPGDFGGSSANPSATHCVIKVLPPFHGWSEAKPHLIVREFHMVTGEIHTVPTCPGTRPWSWLVLKRRRV
jgi:hypothetical protein